MLIPADPLITMSLTSPGAKPAKLREPLCGNYQLCSGFQEGFDAGQSAIEDSKKILARLHRDQRSIMITRRG